MTTDKIEIKLLALINRCRTMYSKEALSNEVQVLANEFIKITEIKTAFKVRYNISTDERECIVICDDAEKAKEFVCKEHSIPQFFNSDVVVEEFLDDIHFL